MADVTVLYGYGINCDNETRYAFDLVGANTDHAHINEFVNGEKNLKDYQILAIPGGFSYGDDIAAGKILATRLKFNLEEQVQQFIYDGKLIIGICNGFQAMVKLGILPGSNGDYRNQTTTLMFNDSGRFEDRWVYLRINPESPCVFTQGIDYLYIPVRHGEGKFFAEEDIIRKMQENNQIVAQYSAVAEDLSLIPTQEYPLNPNGSLKAIAGICDETGRLFGMMPHPEAYLFNYNHPNWTRQRREGRLPEEGLGVKVFRNAVEYVKNNLGV